MCSLYPITKACAIEALTTRLVCCLHLAEPVLFSISPIAEHNTTDSVNDIRAIQHRTTNL